MAQIEENFENLSLSSETVKCPACGHIGKTIVIEKDSNSFQRHLTFIGYWWLGIKSYLFGVKYDIIKNPFSGFFVNINHHCGECLHFIGRGTKNARTISENKKD